MSVIFGRRHAGLNNDYIIIRQSVVIHDRERERETNRATPEAEGIGLE